MAAIPNPADDPGEDNPAAPVLIAAPRLDAPRHEPDDAPDTSARLPEQAPLAPPAPDWVSAWRPPAFGISPPGLPLDPSPRVPEAPVAVATPEQVTPAPGSGPATVAGPERPVAVVAPAMVAPAPATPAPAAPATPVRGPFPPGAAAATAADTAALPRVGRPAPQHRAARTLTTPLPRPRGGRRLRDPIGSWRRVRSGIELLVMTLMLGVLLAAVLAAAIGAIVVALQHALNG